MSQASVAPVVLDLRARLTQRYLRFFRDLGVDPRTGDCGARRPANRKFATYPYIGSRYGNEGVKLLVVGWDIGSDETPGRIQGFERRRRAIECRSVEQHNPHIAGTYFTAVKYAGQQFEWETFEDDPRNCRRILKEEAALGAPGLPPTNPLSRIALTNFYKWVTVGRAGKGGGADRVHLHRDLEIAVFQDEVRILKPDVVVFQSATFRFAFKELIEPCGVAHSYVVNHPSRRGKRHPAAIAEALAAVPPA